VTLEIEIDHLPLFDDAVSIAAQNRSGGLSANEEHFGPGIHLGPVSDRGRTGVGPGSDLRMLLVFDPQTSGVLLAGVGADRAEEAEAAFAAAGVPAKRIGRAVEAIPPIHIHMV